MFIVLLNQPHDHTADDEETAVALAETLAADNPGVTYDVLEVVSQSSAAVPEKPIAVAATLRVRDLAIAAKGAAPKGVVDVPLSAPVDALPG